MSAALTALHGPIPKPTRAEVSQGTAGRLILDMGDILRDRIKKSTGASRNALVHVNAALTLTKVLTENPTTWTPRAVLAAESIVRRLGKRLDHADAIWWQSMLAELDDIHGGGQ